MYVLCQLYVHIHSFKAVLVQKKYQHTEVQATA